MNPERDPASRHTDLPPPRPGFAARIGDWVLAHPWWWVSVVIVVLTVAPPAPVQRLDLIAFDALAGDLLTWLPTPHAKATRVQQPDVVVTIDDASLASVGRWPWGHRQHAQLIERLHEAGAGTIVYDVALTEPAADEQDDEALARAMVRHHAVVLPIASDDHPGVPSGPVQEPPALLAQAAVALGHDEVQADADGRLRRLQLGARSGAHRWDSLPRAVWRHARGERLPEVDGPLGYRDQEIVQARSAWVLEDEALLTGVPGAPLQLSAARVLRDRRVFSLLAGRTVWVGITASGWASPLVSAHDGTATSRVEWLAQVHQALEEGTLVRASSAGERVAAALAPLLLVLVLVPRRYGVWHGGRLLGLAAVPIGIALVGLTLSQMWLPPTAATLGWGLGYVLLRAAHLRDTREDLQRTRGHAAATLRAISDGVITVDADHRVLYMNPVAWRFARSSPQVGGSGGAGLPLGQLMRLGETDRETVARAIDSSLAQQAVVQVGQPVQVHTLVGIRLVRLTVSPIVTSDLGGPSPAPSAVTRLDGAVLVLNDVTDTVRAAERLQHEATHDALTGLPNRVTLAAEFDHALNRVRHCGGQLALLFIDIDRLKRINDGLGHQQGDAAIQRMAERLRAACGPGALAARWGGDEFVALVPDRGDGQDADAAARAVIEAVHARIELDGMQVHCSCSIGIALAPSQGEGLDTLLTHADAALRRAKLHGGGRHAHVAAVTAGEPPATPGWARDALTVENRLRRAIAQGSLELHYQPQLDIASAEPVGFEALLRWRQDSGQLWSPAQFLDVAEESGLILEIGSWAVQEATQQLARWGRAGVPLVPVSVNVSARQCLDRRLVQVVSDALAAERVPASLLKLEITETTAMTDVEQVMHLLQELRALGVGVAVDDFGTGYSSLAHLQRLPIDQIKIDQSFVRDIANDHQGAAIVRATIALAHELGVPVVAEGVEDETQLTFLTLHRCDIVQGYYYARPLSGEAAGAFMIEAQRAAGGVTQPMLALG